jgi:HEAT repeat protein
VPDRTDLFIRRFGDLVALLRVEAGNDAAQELALATAAGVAAEGELIIDSGVERGSDTDELTLQGRMRARGVERLRIARGAEAHELLMLARALSHDSTPMRSTAAIAVDLVVPVSAVAPPNEPPGRFYSPGREAGERRRWVERRTPRAERWRGPERRQGADRRVTGERRLQLVKRQEEEIAEWRARLVLAERRGDWRAALAAAARLRSYAPRVPAVGRRSFAITARRLLSRRVLEAFVELGRRDAAVRHEAAEVLRWSGLDGAESLLAALADAEPSAGRFVRDTLSTMPDALPLIVPLLDSRAAVEASHAAAILGRMGRLEAVAPLKRHASHPDAAVRRAVLQALGAFSRADVAEVVRAALAHPVADTRAAAADAIGVHGAAALAMPLVAALTRERDAGVWSAMVRALGAIGSAEACVALASIALERRTLFPPRGYRAAQRVEVVRVLAGVGTGAAHAALDRLAREGDVPIRSAALAARAAEVPAAG